MGSTTIEDLLTVDDLVRLLQVPRSTVYRWSSTGDGPRPLRVGRYLRWRPEEVERWLAERQKPRT